MPPTPAAPTVTEADVAGFLWLSAAEKDALLAEIRAGNKDAIDDANGQATRIALLLTNPEIAEMFVKKRL